MLRKKGNKGTSLPAGRRHKAQGRHKNQGTRKQEEEESLKKDVKCKNTRALS